MSDIRPPDDSLSSYFDELLKGDLDNHAQIDLPLAVGENFASSNVVSLNSRQKNSPVVEKKSQPLREASKPRADYAEPMLSQDEQDKKQKLEKLLQTAQQQFLKQEQATQPQTLTKTLVEMPEEIQDWPIETKTEVVDVDKTIEARLEQKIAQTEEVESEIQLSEIPNLEWAANGLPQWAQERFDVLLFNVAGLKLAVPLIALGQIYPLTDELTPLFGQADWFMGLQPTSMGKIRTVNTARFVMPEKYNESFLDNAKYVMSLNGVLWGLALDSVNQPMRLDPDQVKWRSDRTKRPWLAGTLKDHMCALLDVPRIAQLLLDADRNHKRR